MKKFNASDLSKKPSQVFAAAREGGAIIQHKDRQGKVVEEFVIVTRAFMYETVDSCTLADGTWGSTEQSDVWNFLQPNNCHCGICEECKGDL